MLDTSALLAVLFGESERDEFIALLGDADDALISAATLVEASIVMQARTGDAGVDDLDKLLAATAARCVAVDEAQAQLAREAFRRYGKGRGPAGLNFGDCFAYALAKATDRPLLCKGEHFTRTDVRPVRAG